MGLEHAPVDLPATVGHSPDFDGGRDRLGWGRRCPGGALGDDGARDLHVDTVGGAGRLRGDDPLDIAGGGGALVVHEAGPARSGVALAGLVVFGGQVAADIGADPVG